MSMIRRISKLTFVKVKKKTVFKALSEKLKLKIAIMEKTIFLNDLKKKNTQNNIL